MIPKRQQGWWKRPAFYFQLMHDHWSDTVKVSRPGTDEKFYIAVFGLHDDLPIRDVGRYLKRPCPTKSRCIEYRKQFLNRYISLLESSNVDITE